jgi:hypothetical protein
MAFVAFPTVPSMSLFLSKGEGTLTISARIG